MSWFQELAMQGTALFLGGVSGGLLGAVALAGTWWWDSRRRTASELLKDGFAIHAKTEAWILDSQDDSLSAVRPKDPFSAADVPALRKVEIRLVLDQSPWNAPTKNFFGVIEGKRTWIVRDTILDGDAYPRTGDVADLRPYPALVSSKGLHELCGWIERVASLCFWRIGPFPRQRRPIALFLSPHDISSLWPLLASIRSADRMRLLESRLSEDARSFLEWHRNKFAKRE